MSRCVPKVRWQGHCSNEKSAKQAALRNSELSDRSLSELLDPLLLMRSPGSINDEPDSAVYGSNSTDVCAEAPPETNSQSKESTGIQAHIRNLIFGNIKQELKMVTRGEAAGNHVWGSKYVLCRFRLRHKHTLISSLGQTAPAARKSN